MGCATSQPTDDIINVCNERLILIQKAINHRENFSDAHLAYITSLENVGSALRQFFGREHTYMGFSMLDTPALVLENFQPISIDSIDVTPRTNNSPGSTLSTQLSNVPKLIIDDHVLPRNSSPMSSMVSPEFPMMKPSLSPPISHPHALILDGTSPEEEDEEAVNAYVNTISTLRRTESLPEIFTRRVDEFYDDDDDDSDAYSPLPPSALIVDSPRFSFDTFTPPVIPEHLKEQRRMKKIDVNGSITHEHDNVKEDQRMHIEVEVDEGIPDLEEIEDKEKEVRQIYMNDHNQEAIPKEVERRVISEDIADICSVNDKGFNNDKVKNENLSTIQREVVIGGKHVKENTMNLPNGMSSPRGKNLSELVNHISDQFVKASKSGEDVSIILETQISQDLKYMKDSLTPFNAFRSYWSKKASIMMQDMQEETEFLECGMSGSHISTLDRLFAWEKKLYDEVKGGEFIRGQFDQKCKQLRILDAKDANDTNVGQREKMRVSLKKLDTRLMVALKAIQGTSKKIRDLTNAELFPQLCELLEGSAKMWKIMRDCHRVQEAILLEMGNLEYIVGSEVIYDTYKDDIADLRHELDQWRRNFHGWFLTQERYVKALCAWLEKCYELKDESRDEMSFKKMKNLESPRDPIFYLLIKWRDSLDTLKARQKPTSEDGVTTFVVKLDLLEESILDELKLRKHVERSRKHKQRHDRTKVKRKYKDTNATSIDNNDLNLEASSPFTIKNKVYDGWQRARLDVLNNLSGLFTSLSGFTEDARDMYEKVKSTSDMKDNNDDDMNDEA